MRRLVPLAFFLTGATSLVFETVWFRRLTLLFGATGYAAATVFTAFMAGLALGALFAGRLSDRLGSPRALLGAYAGLEAGVGLAALALPVSADALVPALRLLAPDPGAAPTLGVAVRFVLALLVLLVPTTMMGATLPLAARAWASAAGRPDEALAPDTGLLYALNTFGAVTGTLLAGFVLLPSLGVSTTNAVAAGANLLVAAAVLALRPRAPGAAATGAAPTHAAGPPPPVALRAGLVLFGIAGGVAMVYEEVWQRALQLVIGSSVYAFAILLSAFLLGLAGGAAVYSRRTARQPGQAANLAVAQLLVALAAAVGALTLDDLPAAFLVLLSAIPVAPAPALAAQSVLAASVVLVPAFFLGMSFPAMLAWHLAASPHGRGRTIGRVYAVNTVGAIVGSFLGGFVLIPTLGMQHTLLALVAVSALLAVGYAILSGSRRTLVAVGLGALLLVLGGPRLATPWNLRAMNAGVFRISTALDLASGIEEGSRAAAGGRALPPSPPLRREDVVRTGFEPVLRSIVRDHREGVTTTVAVTETTLETRAPGVSLTAFALRVNGKPDASITVLHREEEPATRGTPLPAGDMETQVLCGALPAFLEGPSTAAAANDRERTRVDGAERPRDFSPARGWGPRLDVAGGGRSPPGEDSLVVGWGSGVTVATLAGVVPGRVVAVELEPEVVRAARPFAALVPFDRRRVELVLEDARNLLLLDDRRYAVVVSEPSNPWVAGASTLFTEDFFRLVRRRLLPGGRFVQWLQAYEIAPGTVRSVLAALLRVFPSVTVLRMVHSPGDLLLVCGDRPPRFRASPRPLPEVVRRMGIRSPEDVVARVVATTPRLAAFARGARPNTDDRPTVEFDAPLDLVRFRAWGSDRVVRAIVGPDPEALAGAPVDRARLLRALLDAGRPEAALGLGATGDLAAAARAMCAARALADEDAHDDLPARLAAARAAPGDRALRAAVADAYFALGYPERAAALLLGPLAP